MIDRLPVGHQLLQQGPLLQNFLGMLVIIPEVRLGNLGFQLCNPLTLAVDVKDTSSAQQAFPGDFSTTLCLHET